MTAEQAAFELRTPYQRYPLNSAKTPYPLIPREGVVLVITDEQGRESCFGFLRYPEEIRDTVGMKIMDTPFGKRWQFSDFVQNADPRYREIVVMFAEASYLAEV